MKVYDLHGYTLEDALSFVDKELDRAFHLQEEEIEFITGNGKIFNQLIKDLPKSIYVKELKNNGPLAHLYIGRIGIVLNT